MSDLPEGEFYACYVCGRQVDFDAPETVKARRIIHTSSLRSETEEVEGEGLVFHSRCYTDNPRMWRRVN